MIISLHLIRLTQVDLPAWRKTEMQNLTLLSFFMQIYACYRAQSLHTAGTLITLKVLLITAIRDEPAIQQSIAYVSYFQLVSPVS